MEDTLRAFAVNHILSRPESVLILVLMEDTLRVDDGKVHKIMHGQVLILVLMEDTLREAPKDYYSTLAEVLILVLMEDTLRGIKEEIEKGKITCLNPCFNGRYSQSLCYKL
ncbi:hypothetical protein SAMN05444364_11735 [Prevotella scopos JCM 17725]|uniref:Uncharacterized protein n=1 Tax=Prevotella scopos JCM 17725 TaxID=1236518 RepID=A0AAX2F4N6_9BACT|nr:hypothetical protein SAMN05444364_11735 [Prevotella scopos JCM 17725]